MVDYNKILAYPPYEMMRDEKEPFLSEALGALSVFHYQHCPQYRRIIDTLGYHLREIDNYYNLPFLPVRLFKEYDLLSVPKEAVFKTALSSSTTGQTPSTIYLDKVSSLRQTKALAIILASFLGDSRFPMIILDTASVIRNRKIFSARGAGMLGFQIYSKETFFALNDKMELDIDGLKRFLERHCGNRIFLFGFTFLIWRHFYEALSASDYRPDLSNGVLIHGGGWKTLTDRRVSSAEFCAGLREVCGLRHIYNYYGIAEQMGSIYMQCKCGHFHASVFSDVIVRSPNDFSVCGVGEKGIIQTLSILPTSYPGHSLLTEDEGILLGEDDCPCNRKGKYFKTCGRIRYAEIRGCSDTYADSLS